MLQRVHYGCNNAAFVNIVCIFLFSLATLLNLEINDAEFN